MLFLKKIQTGRLKVLLLLNPLHIDIMTDQLLFIVLLLAFLAQEHKRLLAIRKIRTLKHVTDEARLSALQKSGNYIYRYFKHCSSFLSLQTNCF